MSERNNGGPAFPVINESNPDMWDSGMTLRDYFAAKAMQALVGLDPTKAQQLSHPEGRVYGQWVASDAYDIADAMLAERDK